MRLVLVALAVAFARRRVQGRHDGVDQGARRRERGRHRRRGPRSRRGRRRPRRAAASSRTGCASVTSPRRGGRCIPGSRAADGSAQLVLTKPFSTPAQVAGIIREISGTTGPLRDVTVTRDRGLFSTTYSAGGTLDLQTLKTGLTTDPDVVAALANQHVDVNAIDQSLLADRPRLVRVEAGDRPPGTGDHGAGRQRQDDRGRHVELGARHAARRAGRRRGGAGRARGAGDAVAGPAAAPWCDAWSASRRGNDRRDSEPTERVTVRHRRRWPSVTRSNGVARWVECRTPVVRSGHEDANGAPVLGVRGRVAPVAGAVPGMRRLGHAGGGGRRGASDGRRPVGAGPRRGRRPAAHRRRRRQRRGARPHRGRRARPRARRRAGAGVGHPARRGARHGQEHAAAAGARAHGRGRRHAACWSPPRSRARRCGCGPSASARSQADLLVVAETSLPHVLAHVDAVGPEVLALDSIQTVVDPDLPGAPGSVTQVRDCAYRLVQQAKERALRHRARRPRHQGGHPRRPARARARGRHRALVRRRPRPLAACAARARSTGSAAPTRWGCSR